MNPGLKLSILRDIGWREWHPIWPACGNGGWKGHGGADEYDTYLLEAAAKIRSGEHEQAVADYLARVETESMGLGRTPDVETRARATLAAIKVYVGTLG